jgi:hypothetical protein
MYCDQLSRFQGDVFKHFNGLVEFVDDTISWGVDDTISMRWITYLNPNIDHLAFELGANTYGQGTRTISVLKFGLLIEMFMLG